MNTVMQSERSMSRLRLRHDLVFAQVPGGALVRHSDGGFVLRGQTTYRWLTSLAPFLDGSRTAAELVDGLDDPRSKRVTTFSPCSESTMLCPWWTVIRSIRRGLSLLGAVGVG